jgi:P4 family phage/plasmid primase-like protien
MEFEEEILEPNWEDSIEKDNTPELSEVEEKDNTPQVYAFDDIEKKPSYEIEITYGPENNFCLSSKEHITIEEMAIIIQRDNYFATDGASKDLYVFINQGVNAGTYIEAKDSINWAIKQICQRYDKGKYWTSKAKMGEVYNWINQGLRTIENPEIKHINVANGLIYLTSKGEFIHHTETWSPEYLTTTKLPVNYNPKAKCPAWEKFVKEVFPEDSQHLAWEIAALLMIPLKNKAASAIILKGQKNTGKTTFQNGILAFIGEKNYCSLSPHEFGERFMNSRLKGVLVNVVGDLTNSKLSAKAVGTIKQLIGNDLISGENKYGATYSFKPYARNLFSCNEMPTCDSDDAFFDRFLIIPFNNQFSKNPFKEKELNEALSSDEELSGLFNKALEVLPKVIQEGIQATISMKEEYEKVVEENDPLASLLSNCDSGFGYATPCNELHEFYTKIEPNDWARKSNRRFGRDFKKLFPHIIRKQLSLEGRTRIWCYVGIKLEGKKDEEQIFDDGVLEAEFEDMTGGNAPLAPKEDEE